MNEFASKWEEIYQKGHSAGRFRVFPDHPLDFFLAFSLHGKREVMVEAVASGITVPDLPTFQNIELSITEVTGGLRIGMTLNDENLSQSFSVMCYDLVQRSSKGINVPDALQIFLTALSHWADLFKQKLSGGLTRPETMGLLGELLVLEHLITKGSINVLTAVKGWRGPDGDARDIGFNGSRIEVKTQLSTKAITLKVSSLDQLDDNGGKLHVVLNRISPAENSSHSLNEVVSRLSDLLSQSRYALSEFERKLELASFDNNSGYSKEKFGLDQTIIYLVNESFPRLTPQNVPQGIFTVCYEIRGIALESHTSSWEELLGTINE
jgi:hypothetical protein